MDSNGLSLGDAMALTGERGGNGFGGNNGDWLAMIFLFALIFGFGGNGFGGYGARGGAQPVTEAGLCSAMNFQDLQNQVGRGFEAQRSAEMNTQNGLSTIGYESLQNTYALQNAMTAGFANQAQAYCETQRAIDSVNYNGAMNTAQIVQAQQAGTQKILDAITGNRMADMQNQINALQLQSALCGVVRYPMQTTYNSGGNPFCGCGCGNI